MEACTPQKDQENQLDLEYSNSIKNLKKDIYDEIEIKVPKT